MTGTTKLIILLALFALHIIKSIWLYRYNKKLNPTVSYSDLLGYITSAYFSLYIEEAPPNMERKAILLLYRFILLVLLVMVLYALVLIVG